MRRKRNDQTTLDFTPLDPQIEEEFEIMHEILEKIDGILQESETLLEKVAADIVGDADRHAGRLGMSAEQVLRVVVVKQMHGWSYETLYRRLNDSICLRRFCRYEFQRVPKTSALQENVKKLSAETLQAVNQALIRYAKEEAIEGGKKTRIDTTAVETNIHHPTDSSLIWDGVRVITRILQDARRVFPQAGIQFHNRTRVVKKRAFAIANAKRASKRVKLYKELLGYGWEVLGYGRDGVDKLMSLCGTDDEREAARIVADHLNERVDLLAKVIDQTRRRVIDGEKVPAAEKVVSIFEPHTDIIEKGGRETVFGHKVCLTVGERNLVLDCQMERGNLADTSLFAPALDRHIEQYGHAPGSLAADGGFASQENARYALEKGVEEMCFTKHVGSTLKDLLPSGAVRKLLMKFRAGCEGIVSALKRGVGLTRCLWEGWESFKSYVWSSIVAHNLKMLTRALMARRKRQKKQPAPAWAR